MRTKLQIIKKLFKYYWVKSRKVYSLEALVDRHFKYWSEPDHINRHGLTVALKNVNSENPVLVETGTSAYGTDSSRLLDAFVTYYGGVFHSVDLNPDASKRLLFQHSTKSHFYIGDSVTFLKDVLGTKTKSVDLFYLDSFDVDWENPLEAAKHGLAEFKTLLKYVKTGTIVVIDDTPATIEYIPKQFHKNTLQFLQQNGVLPGKGALILKEIRKIKNIQVLYHKYNLVLKFTSNI